MIVEKMYKYKILQKVFTFLSFKILNFPVYSIVSIIFKKLFLHIHA